MAVAVAPREIGVLDYLADFSDEKTKYVNRCVKDLALWLGEIGKYAEIELIDHEIVDLGNLTKGLKLCDGAFDLATLPKEMVDFSSIVSSGGVRDVSRATSSLIGSVCKSALWLGKADVLPLGAATSSFSAVKSVSTIYSMGNNAIDDGIKLYSARSRAIAETGTQERINSLKDTKTFYSAVRNVSIVALSLLGQLAECAVLSVSPIMMLTLSSISLLCTTNGFMIQAEVNTIQSEQNNPLGG